MGLEWEKFMECDGDTDEIRWDFPVGFLRTWNLATPEIGALAIDLGEAELHRSRFGKSMDGVENREVYKL